MNRILVDRPQSLIQIDKAKTKASAFFLSVLVIAAVVLIVGCTNRHSENALSRYGEVLFDSTLASTVLQMYTERRLAIGPVIKQYPTYFVDSLMLKDKSTSRVLINVFIVPPLKENSVRVGISQCMVVQHQSEKYLFTYSQPSSSAKCTLEEGEICESAIAHARKMLYAEVARGDLIQGSVGEFTRLTFEELCSSEIKNLKFDVREQFRDSSILMKFIVLP